MAEHLHGTDEVEGVKVIVKREKDLKGFVDVPWVLYCTHLDGIVLGMMNWLGVVKVVDWGRGREGAQAVFGLFVGRSTVVRPAGPN